jgi:hypothetical protein
MPLQNGAVSVVVRGSKLGQFMSPLFKARLVKDALDSFFIEFVLLCCVLGKTVLKMDEQFPILLHKRVLFAEKEPTFFPRWCFVVVLFGRCSYEVNSNMLT